MIRSKSALSRPPFMRRLSGALAALAAAALLALVPSSAALAGGATYCVNCATTFTQMSQYAEEIQGVLQQVQTVRNTMQSSMYLQQSLQQLDPSTLANLNGMPLSDIQAMSTQYGTLGNLSGSYNGLLQQMSAFQMGAQSNNMTPSQYLQFQANQAKAGNKQYQQQIAMQQAAITDTNQQLTELQNEAAGSPAVTSQVNGMQQLLTNNIKTQELLVSMNKNMEVANLNASQNAEAESADKAASIADQQKAAALQKQLSGMSVQLPTSSELMSASSASSSSSGNQP